MALRLSIRYLCNMLVKDILILVYDIEHQRYLYFKKSIKFKASVIPFCEGFIFIEG